jgi:hypothetical protein
VTIRYASWDLSWVHLVDERTCAVLCRLYPLDKAANADGQRRTLEPLAAPVTTAAPSPEIPPLLAKMLAEQQRTGLPPAYLPKDEREREPARDTDDGGAS